MNYYYKSTRGSSCRLDFCASVLKGIGDDGGLLVPDFELPELNLNQLKGLKYAELAAKVLSAFAPEIPMNSLLNVCTEAYASSKFPEDVVPVVKAGNIHIAELFRGPTAAFKDMALQLLPRLMTLALERSGGQRKALILTATSGDTGKAALEGFADVKDTIIKVFYPVDGVSAVQRQQMVSQQGDNVEVVAIKGNFDDAQRAVKEAFASKELQMNCGKKNLLLTSANSINIGRLAPQVVYYFHSYLQLVERKVIRMGMPVNFVVPSGNFGNCLAGVMARRMGLPVKRFIIASNRNNILTDFFTTGTYDANRPFYKTNAPAMDILISSNLERLLWLLTEDCQTVSSLMEALRTKGCYRICDDTIEKIKNLFYAGWQSEEEVVGNITRWYRQTGYLADTHTAVALGVYDQYLENIGDTTPSIVLATASPYKFPASVCRSVTGSQLSEEDAGKELCNATGIAIPDCLQNIMERDVIHRKVIDRTDIVTYINNNIQW